MWDFDLFYEFNPCNIQPSPHPIAFLTCSNFKLFLIEATQITGLTWTSMPNIILRAAIFLSISKRKTPKILFIIFLSQRVPWGYQTAKSRHYQNYRSFLSLTLHAPLSISWCNKLGEIQDSLNVLKEANYMTNENKLEGPCHNLHCHCSCLKLSLCSNFNSFDILEVCNMFSLRGLVQLWE